MRAARRLRVPLAMIGLVAFAATARADAPIDQYAVFDMSAVTIQDMRTGLIWQREASAQSMDFYDAATYCEELSLATPEGGTTGWRVPSYKELLTLVDETPHTEYVGDGLIQLWIDANAFPQTAFPQTNAPLPLLEYWTSSLSLSAGMAYDVDFGNGSGGQEQAAVSLFVRCVHD
ncbi:MAG: DUF1566 domain-containing protein [Polyangiaceae bacterium]|jgi:hypothetical protein